MINEKLICDNVEKYINGEIDNFDLSFLQSLDGPVEKYLSRTAVRLINEYTAYKEKRAGVSDYLASLRNFLLSYRSEISIKDSNIIEKNHFGIHEIGNGKYLASQDLPEFFQHKSFAEAATITSDTALPKTNNKYLLETNSFIYQLTGFEKFKSVEQQLCVYGALNTPKGYTTLVCMPTGGGKSLISQTLAYAEKGLTIVIVPTVSLAIDQERAAKSMIKSETQNQEIFSYYSGVANVEKIYKAIEEQHARLLFISPEALLKNNEFKQQIATAVQSHYLKNIVIDEAHIVVAWGDFFRVDYQCLAPWRDGIMKVNPDIRTYLLSATFDDHTVKILKDMFSTNNKWIEIRCDSLRKEPRFVVLKASNFYDKKNKTIELVNKLPHPMILYVKSPCEAEYWKKYLEEKGYLNVKTFHGDTRNKEREELIQGWIDNQFDIMIATSAFGVGVDKPDVRTVIHLYVPESADSYYQELGRGGRDGLPCLSVMCISPKDDLRPTVNKILTEEKLYKRWEALLKSPRTYTDNINGSLSVDTSIVRSNGSVGAFKVGNKKDAQWNINMLLLLSRYKEIHIEDLTSSSDGNYNFTIKILNDNLLKSDEELIKHFIDLRNREKAVANERFNILRNHINRVGAQCWSDMFEHIYPYVSEFCAGCDNHINPIIGESDRFPLLNKVVCPKQELNPYVSKYFGNVKEAIYINKNRNNISNVLHNLIDFGYDTIVTDDSISHKDTVLTNPQMIIMNYLEFKKLMENDDHFFVSELVIAILHMHDMNSLNNFVTIQNYVKKQKGYAIYIVDENVSFGINNKKLSEMIDGPVITEGMLGGNE